MRMIAITKVIIQTKPFKSKAGAYVKSGQPKITQPGDCNWVMIIKGINAIG